MCSVPKNGGACPHAVRRSELDGMRVEVAFQAAEIDRLRAFVEIRERRFAAASARLKEIDRLCAERSDCNPLLRKIRGLAAEAVRGIDQIGDDVEQSRHAQEREQAA